MCMAMYVALEEPRAAVRATGADNNKVQVVKVLLPGYGPKNSR